MMDTTCRFCGTLRWKDESSGMCCSNGKVCLPLIDLPPEPLRSLLSGENSDSVHLLRNIRKYNSCFQMTSFGAENQTHSVTFPTIFSIQGQVYHRIGSLMPSENQPSRYLQIYFMSIDDDDDIQTDRRCQQIQGVRRNIVQGLQRMLHQHNLLVQQFKTALENLPSDAYRVVVNADRIPPGQHPRRYDAPTANEVAVVLAGNQFGSRDIVLHQRDNLLKHVSDTHRFYDALQYPLIFWKGQEGYSFHIPQIDPNTSQPLSSKVSSMDFYGYFIMVRRNSPNVIVQFGQLFHQFLVDMYAKDKKQLDRHDITARVFRQKLVKFIGALTKGQLYGAAVAWMYSVEWQKRGLPHAHILVWLANKLRPTQIDSVICAEFPDPIQDPLLYNIVVKNMIHGPCGEYNPVSPCMKNSSCSKKYPKQFLLETQTNENGYPLYRRRAPEAGGFTAKVKIRGREEVTIDNRWVVPYSPLLSKMFCAHINVENCSSVKAIKYICKYVNKGSDQAIINLRREGRGPDPQNEVRMYQCARYINSNEAVWRLLSFPLHQRHPAVIHLAVHLENGERIYFNQNTLAHRMHNPPRTTLTAFFSLCQTDSFARTLLYPDVPQYYTWNSSAHEWRRRVQGKLVKGQPGVKRSDTIGRVYAVHVSNFERFCLRMLLHNIKGPTSFAYLKIVNGSQYETFRETCAALGLLENDNHWVVTMDEAVLCQAPTRVRQLFAILISTCTISNPQKLWITYRDEMASDILHRYQLLDSSIRCNDLIYNETLCNIEDRVVSICGKKLQELGLGAPRRNVVTNSDILRELAYDTAELEDNVASMLPKLLPEQRRVFDAVLAKINLSQPIIIFLDAPGGTGKTFLLNLLLAMIRKEQNIAIAVASSGIAATLLAGGRTAHSVLKLPLTFAEGQTAVCNIRKNSDKASLLRSCKLLVWDECTMAHKIALEALDRTLQDIRDDPQPSFQILFAKWWNLQKVLILIRNLDPPRLCNGTRLCITQMGTNVLQARILTGSFRGEEVLIPRIPIIPNDLPFKFRRLQFPVMVAFSLTINKSQGQTLQVVGVHLEFRFSEYEASFKPERSSCIGEGVHALCGLRHAGDKVNLLHHIKKFNETRKVKRVQVGNEKQQFMFTKVSQESEAAVHASYVLSEMIDKHSKPFTEGDFIKECLIKAAEIVCPGTQLAVFFFRACDTDFNIFEELLELVPMHGTTTGEDIFNCVYDLLQKYNLPQSKLTSVATDGAPSMTGKTNGLSYYTEVRWISCSKVLKQFWDLKEEICQFLITKNQNITLFSDQVWLQDFSFMVDITKHLSDLNLKLQGKEQIITNMCDQVNAFKCALVLLEKQLKNEDLMHFPTCNMYKSSLGETASYQKYAEKILSLRNEFETRKSLALAKWRKHLAFNRICLEHNFIPPSLRVKDPARNPFSAKIIKETQIGLLKSRIKGCHSFIRLTSKTIKDLISITSQKVHPDIMLNLITRTTQDIKTLNAEMDKKHNRKLRYWSMKYKIQFNSEKQQPKIVNLSSTELTKDETKFLSKGLKHRNMKTSDNLKIIAGLEASINGLNHKEKAKIRNIVTTALSKTPNNPKSNPANRNIARRLRDKSEIVITRSDKGAQKYYEPVSELEKIETYNKFKKELRHLQRQKTISDEELKNFISKMNTEAYIYGLPKLHKTGIPLRTIVAYYLSPAAPLAKFLNMFLTPILRDSNSHTTIKSIPTFMQEIWHNPYRDNHTMIGTEKLPILTVPLGQQSIARVDRFSHHSLSRLKPHHSFSRQDSTRVNRTSSHINFHIRHEPSLKGRLDYVKCSRPP
ncbi:hypothetical protein LAZ67_20001335 [Cordylochernes scorpioides]|uniref:ATP-dependent DNA helicase n=1 Tax=Cordylochernes scorpioides TaxID=51811 RepID=A0ABY6LP32_9ARAC|nr:hypothetical protein LAZ67_20001335 [Cordylochernes scorpioides]